MQFGIVTVFWRIFCVIICATTVLCVCPQGQYGARCEYACHCPPGTECDPVTGQCPAGCAVGWSGAPYCQAVNVARNKKTYQHGTYLGWNSSRAVDGDPDQDGTYGSCSWAHNNDDVFKTWWNVDLGSSYYVQSIEIYFRTDDAMSESRRAGLRIYISETIEEAKNEGLCYMDQMTDFVFPPSHLILREGSLGCSLRRGRFLILYVDRPKQTPMRNCPKLTMFSCWANLELCEVEIYVCSNGTYGDVCQNRCHCDADARCDAKTGVCPGHCRAGYQGTTCSNACEAGRFGINCNGTCGHCLDDIKSCDRVSGACAECQAGWTGERCDQPCPAGMYGLACREQCGNCIGACDPQTGVCSLGCRPGWIGSQCREVCATGYFGPSCESACSYCEKDDVCDHVTGSCPRGCEAGFTGDRCDKQCPAGSHGAGCGEQCGQCREDMPCNHLTGVCPVGCKDGWKGYTCKDECPPGSYGQQCSGQCGICREGLPCSHVTGLCTDGCSDGWTGEKCKNRCTPGHHGANCSQVCGSCLHGEPCDHVTGACLSGCNDGWRGDDCMETCQATYYGVQCQKKCGRCKEQTICDHVTGHCPGGCQPQYYGEFCILSLSTSGTSGDKTDGSTVGGETTNISVLIGGVMAGVVVVFAGIILFVIFRRRSRNKPRPQRQGSAHKRTDTHTNVEILGANGEVNQAGPSESPTPSRASSRGTNFTNCTQSHISVDDQEVLYVNLKKNKTPVPRPVPVPSPNLSTFQRLELAPRPAPAIDMPDPTYYNTKDELSAPSASGVPVADFHKYIKDMDQDKTNYKDQYTKYPHGMKYPHEAGKRPRNKFKNRFAQMFPYDHSRVVLEEEPAELDSDYINANFIGSVDYPHCYIATQGPNKITLKDFWRMVWQQKCGKIVMLTNLVEESKNKCERYWPNDRVPMTFGELNVELTQTHEYPYYTLRIMRITHETVTDDIREIKQFHFTAWPDHGVPDTFELVSFFKFVLRSEMTLPGPMVVHCSAGVGRTGTFVAVDALYHYGKRGNNIDIPAFVHKMRQNRMNMIQTLDQYRLLHYALLEALGYGDTTLSKSAFRSECHRHLQNQNASQKNRIGDEYQKLEDLRPKPGNESYLSALRKENVEKNRTLNILAADKYRPFLSTYIADTTDYINAVVIPSRNNKMGYIASQLPLRNTITDLWRLIYDHGSCIIVSLNALDEDQEDACAWWPSLGDTVTFGPLVIETLAVETPRSEVTERTFRVLRKGVKDSKLVYMITYNCWQPGRHLPQSIESFLVLHGRVSTYRKSFPDHPITVLCLDGVTCSGVFVAVSNILDQLVQDDECDVYNVTRQLMIRRPQVIRDREQYFFIYQAVYNYIESTSAVYGNL